MTFTQSMLGFVRNVSTCVILPTLLVACSSSGTGIAGSDTLRADTGNPASRITACKSVDRPIANQSQCLQDDAACYEIADGGWCTGPRGNTCPAGSQALPAGSVCPTGSRCFRYGESLECLVQ